MSSFTLTLKIKKREVNRNKINLKLICFLYKFLFVCMSVHCSLLLMRLENKQISFFFSLKTCYCLFEINTSHFRLKIEFISKNKSSN